MPTITPIPFGGGAPHSTGFAGTFVAAAIGAVTLLAAPWFTRGVVSVDRWLIRALLGPGQLAERVRSLEESRALAVDDSAALLRRLERDLHDGAQVRLVALAMSLDMAKERLGREGNRSRTRLGYGNWWTPRTATPPRPSPSCVTWRAGSIPRPWTTVCPTHCRPWPRGALCRWSSRWTCRSARHAAIETIAYFCAAELLTNVIKHSGARRAVLRVAQEDGLLRLRVTDDGRGGATFGAGSGLTGLRQRVRTVDGRLDVSSPNGGPTAVTVELPLHA